MRLKKSLVVILVLLIVLIALLIFVAVINGDNDTNNFDIFNTDNKANVNPNEINTTTLGSNDKGSVQLIGPIGNENSDVKIAYIIGIHPLESTVHMALYDSLISKSESLNYSYYIYNVNHTDTPANRENGRMNGQLLAQEFIVPDATSKDYDLVVDVHANRGTNGGSYEETNFIFAPLNDPDSKVFADKIIADIPPLVYYYPASQTSPSFVTIPIVQSGTPTIIYETYKFESNQITIDLINKLINTIDNLDFE